MNISVFGLGKLGLPLAVVLASKGHKVTGVDLNSEVVAQVNIGLSPIDETGLQDLMDSCEVRVSATNDAAVAVKNSDISFIITPTPSEDDGGFSNQYVLQAINAIQLYLKKKDTRHVIVVNSTVMPGSCNGEITDAIQKSGLIVGDGVGLCYSPEFIALGSVIHDLTQPDMVLVGESDAESGEVLEKVMRTVVGDTVPFQHMNLVNAEIAKIAVNAYITMKISYANTLADICEHIAHANAGIVARAIGQDSRIGTKYLKPATAYGGPCFPRDNRAFAALALRSWTAAPLALASDEVNDWQIERLASLLQVERSVGILGLSYKPDTAIVEESVGIRLARVLTERGKHVFVYDPVAQEAAYGELGDSVSWGSSAESCLDQVGAAVVCTPWTQFGGLQAHKPMTLIDCWGVLPDQPSFVNLYRIGEG